MARSLLSEKEHREAMERARRRAKNSPLVKEELRLLIQGEDLIADLGDITRQLRNGVEPVRMEDGALIETPMGPGRVSSLKAAADVKLALLRKVLPDLKAVELSGPDGGPLVMTEEVNPVELLTRLRALRADGVFPGPTGEVGAGATAPDDELPALGPAEGADGVGEAEGPESVGSLGWTPERGFL